MKLTLTNGNLVNIEAKLKNATETDVSIPASVSYAIVKNLAAIDDALKPFFETKDKIIKQESGGKSSIRYEDDPQAFENVTSKIAELSEITVDVEIATIDFDSISDEKLPISFVSAIGFMINK